MLFSPQLCSSLGNHDYSFISKDCHQDWRCALWHWGVQDIVLVVLGQLPRKCPTKVHRVGPWLHPTFRCCPQRDRIGLWSMYPTSPCRCFPTHALCDTYDFSRRGCSRRAIHQRYLERPQIRQNRLWIRIQALQRKSRVTSRRRVTRLSSFLYLILLGNFKDETRDSNKAFNTVLFVVSHSGTFKRRIRNVVRAAYEERFALSTKQRARLDQWENGDATKPAVNDDDDDDDKTTTEEEMSDDYYISDDS